MDWRWCWSVTQVQLPPTHRRLHPPKDSPGRLWSSCIAGDRFVSGWGAAGAAHGNCLVEGFAQHKTARDFPKFKRFAEALHHHGCIQWHVTSTCAP